MVHAGCVFVAGIHPSRTLMSGSFESVRLNGCAHRRKFGLYSHPKEFFFFFFFEGMESEPMLTTREKSLLPKAQRRMEPAALHHAGLPNSLLNELFPARNLIQHGPLWSNHLLKLHHLAPDGFCGYIYICVTVVQGGLPVSCLCAQVFLYRA